MEKKIIIRLTPLPTGQAGSFTSIKGGVNGVFFFHFLFLPKNVLMRNLSYLWLSILFFGGFTQLFGQSSFSFDNPGLPVFTKQEKTAQKLAGEKVKMEILLAFSQGKSSYSVVPGNYRFDNLIFHDLQRSKDNPLTIKAKGASFWFDLPVVRQPIMPTALGFENCSHIIVDGLTIDRGTPGLIEGKIVEIDFKNNRIGLKLTYGQEIVKNYKGPSRIIPFKSDGRFCVPLYMFQQNGGLNSTISTGATENDCWVQLSNTLLLSSFRDPEWKQSYGDLGILTEGDGLTLMYTTCRAINLENCANISIVNVNNHIPKGCGRENHGYGGHLWKNCYFGPRPGTNQWQGGDGYMFNGTRFGPTLDGMVIEHTTDDVLNIHGYWENVKTVSENKITVSGLPKGSVPGDSLKLYRHDGRLLLKTAITEIAGNTITLDKLPNTDLTGAAIDFMNFSSSHWVIKNCRFIDCFQRILIQSGSGVFENNEITRIGSFLKIGHNYDLGTTIEGGTPENIIIRDNRFTDVNIRPKGEIIYTSMPLPVEDKAPCRNFTISGNVFNHTSGAAVFFSGLGDIYISNNTFNHPFKYSTLSKATEKRVLQPVQLDNCDQIKIDGNTLFDPTNLTELDKITNSRLVGVQRPTEKLSISEDLLIDAPYLISPADGETSYLTFPHFDWQTLNGAEEYLIQIATDTGFNSIINQDTIFHFIDRYVSNLELKVGDHFWRVAALNKAGNQGPWSKIRKISIAEPEKTYVIAPDADFISIRNLIFEASKNTPAKVVFSKGTYRIGNTNPKQYLIDIPANTENLVIDGNGALIILNTISPFVLINDSKGIQLKNFSFDYDPTPYAAGRIINVNTDDGTFDVEQLPSTTFFKESEAKGTEHGLLIDPDYPRIRIGALQTFPVYKAIKHISEQVFRFNVTSTEDVKLLKAGLIWAQGPRQARFFFVNNSEDIVLSDFVAYSAANEGIVVNKVKRFSVMNGKAILGEGRYLGFLNGIFNLHSCREAGPWIEGCVFENNGDDICHINSYNYWIKEKIDEKTLLIYGIADIETGDHLQIINKSALKGLVSEPEVVNVQLVKGNTLVFLNSNVGEVNCGRDNINSFTNVFVVEQGNPQFVFRNNICQNNRRNGLIIKGHKGLVENNIFEGNGVAAISIQNYNTEGENCTDYMIRRNFIRQVGLESQANSAVIRAFLLNTGSWQGIKNIHIRENTIVDCRNRAFDLMACDGVYITNNRIIDDEWHSYASKSNEIIKSDNCSNIVFQNNEIFAQRKLPHNPFLVNPEADIIDRDNTIKEYLWSASNIGEVGFSGSVILDKVDIGTVKLNGAGNNFENESEGLFFYNCQVNQKDKVFRIRGRLKEFANMQDFGNAGIMFRESTTANTPMASLSISVNGALVFEYRNEKSLITDSVEFELSNKPIWLMLEYDEKEELSGWFSMDGLSWNLLVKKEKLNWKPKYTGLYACGGRLNDPVQVIFDRVSINPELNDRKICVLDN